MEPPGGKRIAPFRATKRSTTLRRLRKITRRSRVHVQTVGLNAETKRVSAPSRRRKMSLDIPFYRTSPVTTYQDLRISSICYSIGRPAIWSQPCYLPEGTLWRAESDGSHRVQLTS